jgi:Ca2+-binding EF-hand superfamily protein
LLKPFIEDLKNSISKYDEGKTRLISINNFKNILNELDIEIKDKHIDFLIYYLKKFDDGSYNLEDLKYEEVNNFLKFKILFIFLSFLKVENKMN